MSTAPRQRVLASSSVHRRHSETYPNPLWVFSDLRAFRLHATNGFCPYPSTALDLRLVLFPSSLLTPVRTCALHRRSSEVAVLGLRAHRIPAIIGLHHLHPVLSVASDLYQVASPGVCGASPHLHASRPATRRLSEASLAPLGAMPLFPCFASAATLHHVFRTQLQCVFRLLVLLLLPRSFRMPRSDFRLGNRSDYVLRSPLGLPVSEPARVERSF